jgi:hypothetical protein
MKLHMGRTQKIAICFTFLLGSLYVTLHLKTINSRRQLAHKPSVCFASLYRIITITRLVQTTDISWAKSDVFIWSSVEPSIGIISGCLPTLRPLLMHILDPWRKFIPSSNKSSSAGKGSHQYPMDPIETISKKRTRKISKRDELDSLQFTQLEDEVGAKEDNTIVDRIHSRNWRPDDDELQLTTTTIRRAEDGHSGVVRDSKSLDDEDRDSIIVTRRFEWTRLIDWRARCEQSLRNNALVKIYSEISGK